MKLKKRLLALCITIVLLSSVLVAPVSALTYTNGTWKLGNSTYVSIKSCDSYLAVSSTQTGVISKCTSYSSSTDSSGNNAYVYFTATYVDKAGNVTYLNSGNHKAVNSTLTRTVTMDNYGSITATYTPAGQTSLNYSFMGTFAFK